MSLLDPFVARRGNERMRAAPVDLEKEGMVTSAEIAVTLGGRALAAVLASYFFGAKKVSATRVEGGAEEIEVTVKGGYSFCCEVGG